MDKHLVVAGCIVASLICLGFATYGVRTGIVSAPQGRHTTPVRREEDPLRFWTAVGIYLGIAAVLIYWAWTDAV